MRAILLTVLLLALAGAGSAASEGDRLPFLPAGGAERPEQRVPLPMVPEWLPGPPEDSPLPDEDAPEIPVPARLRPDVSAIEAAFPAGPDRARALAAVRAAFGRTVRLEIAISGPAGERKISGEVPEGGLLRVDDREESTWPRGLAFEAKAATPRARRCLTGLLLLASAVRIAPDLYAVSLGVQDSKIGKEHRLEGGRVTLLAPEIEFASLAAEIPVRPGTPGAIRARDADGREDFRVTVAVSPLETPPGPPGTRGVLLALLSPLLAPGPLPEPGRAISSESSPDPEYTDRRDPEIPPEWMEVPGVAAGAVRPGLAVFAGAEEALARLDGRIREFWNRERPARTFEVTGPGGSMSGSVLAGRPLLFAKGVRIPTVTGIESIRILRAVNRAPVVTDFFTGRCLTLEVPAAGAPRAVLASGGPGGPTSRTAVLPVVRDFGSDR